MNNNKLIVKNTVSTCALSPDGLVVTINDNIPLPENKAGQLRKHLKNITSKAIKT